MTEGSKARRGEARNKAEEPAANKNEWMAALPCTDQGNAERLVRFAGERLRYVHGWNTWLVWDGRRWARDTDGEADRLAKETVRQLGIAAARLPIEEGDKRRGRLLSWAQQSANVGRHRAMLAMAESEMAVALTASALDPNPFLFNVQNGTIDLETGELLPHDPTDLITNLSPAEYDADADARRWRKFLREILPDADDRKFLQRSMGYMLTGLTTEQFFWLMFGSGDNGKSAFFDVMLELLGTYGLMASNDLLLIKKEAAAPYDLARIRGKRMVLTMETPAGRRLNEAMVKQITGGDRLVARRPYGDFFEFESQAKLVMATNHKPIVSETTHAMWRRMLALPFSVRIPKAKQDKFLKKKLMEHELPGILRWAVQGCLAWQHHDGVVPSHNVHQATAEYREESDMFARFLRDACDVGPGQQAASEMLYSAFRGWCHDNGVKNVWTSTAFGRELSERGFDKKRVSVAGDRATVYFGVGVRGAGKLRVVQGGADDA